LGNYKKTSYGVDINNSCERLACRVDLFGSAFVSVLKFCIFVAVLHSVMNASPDRKKHNIHPRIPLEMQPVIKRTHSCGMQVLGAIRFLPSDIP
jgi:hypothetical protein